jgi:hypothetical protein
MKFLQTLPLSLALFVLAASPAGAAVYEFGAILSGAEEVPPVETIGNGEALVLFDDETGDFTWNLIFQDLSSPIGVDSPTAHIHSGGIGVNGPVVIPLDGDGGIIIGNGKTEGIYFGAVDTDEIEGGADIVSDLFAGNLYFNLHTTNNPGGEIRGQILPAFITVVPVPAAAWLFASALGLLGWLKRSTR